MPVRVKICGLTTVAAIAAAADGGASEVGFVFYPPSPRALTPSAAAALALRVPGTVKKVGVFVDPDDALITAAVAAAELDIIQLHGHETPERVARVKQMTGCTVWKACPVAGREDVAIARAYERVADAILFDAKPPTDDVAGLPGGNGLAFDWALLRAARLTYPWILSGGLDAECLADALRISGARHVDVSSGVEDAPGKKSVAKIRAFLEEAGMSQARNP